MQTLENFVMTNSINRITARSSAGVWTVTADVGGTRRTSRHADLEQALLGLVGGER